MRNARDVRLRLSFNNDFKSRTHERIARERQEMKWRYGYRHQPDFTQLLLWSMVGSSGRTWSYQNKGSSDSSDCFAKIAALLLIIAAVVAVFIATYFIIKYLAEKV